jgi:hypothetical protein
MMAAIRSAASSAPHAFPPKALWRFMPVERASIRRCPGLFARACDRPEIDPASVASPHPDHPSHAQSSRRVSTDLRRGGTPETILVTDLVTAHTSPGHDNGPQALARGPLTCGYTADTLVAGAGIEPATSGL